MIKSHNSTFISIEQNIRMTQLAYQLYHNLPRSRKLDPRGNDNVTALLKNYVVSQKQEKSSEVGLSRC